MFPGDEKVLTLMDSIVKECECTGKACNRITENSYNGIEPHERLSSSTEQVYGSPKSQKDKNLMKYAVPEKTCNSRNKKLLPNNKVLFGCEIKTISIQLVNSWL